MCQEMGVSFLPVKSLVLFLERIVGKRLSGLSFGEAFKATTDEDLAVSEDCLHLAVSTPRLPDQTANVRVRALVFYAYKEKEILTTFENR